MKKYLFLFVIALLTACGNPNIIEFDVSAPGLTDGTFVVKDDAGKTVFGANVINGKCTVKSSLEAEGFYTIDVVKNGSKGRHPVFEIFLEPGKYAIAVDAERLSQYPVITSDSKRQQEISIYHNLVTRFSKSMQDDVDKAMTELREKGDRLNRDQFNVLNKKMADAQDKARAADFNALEKFIKTNPNSEFAARFMEQQNYRSDPAKYYALYELMSTQAKNSAEGKMIGESLSHLVKLAPGQTAPAIAGKTFDGKTFAQITAGKKLFLIDFWRSGNSFSRTNHSDIADIYNEFKSKGFEVISVSLDSKADWWTTAVKDDKLPWPQMADLKGNDSPNALNWGISKVPTYDLVSGDWKLIAMDVNLVELKLSVSEYLEKHK
ncbi:TlpA family protein disulfide reductase [Mucilaginibacter sp. AW1-3]